MPALTRTERRKKATKRTIMGILEDADEDVAKPVSKSTGKDFFSTELDKSNPEHIRLLIGDIENCLEDKRENFAFEKNDCRREQDRIFAKGIMKLSNKVRKLSVKDFNQNYSCDLLQMMKDVSNLTGKKRDHEVMKTPANPKSKSNKAPNSIMRTVRRGEPVFSERGSPVEQVEKDSLVATVAKRRRGNNESSSSALDLAFNVGDGRYVNLAEPGTMKHLDKKMQSTVYSHIKVLQDQLGALMSQVSTEDNK